MEIRPKIWGVVCLLLASAASGAEETEVAALLRKVKATGVVARIDAFSQRFLGKPFLDAPLGEGGRDRYDHGPLYRFDCFDCTTFVETTLALAVSQTPAEFERKLIQIRYRDSNVSFASRNHFPCLDWIPQATGLGLFRDATGEIGKAWGVETATAKIDKRGWYAKLPLTTIRVPGITPEEQAARLQELQAQALNYPPVEASVSYIPLAKFIHRTEAPETERARRAEEEKAWEQKRLAEGATPEEAHNEVVDMRLRHVIDESQVDPALLAAIPSGTLMNIVRPNWAIPGTRMNISHQGWVIRRKGQAYFRHVSRSTGRVKDVSLENYLRLLLLSPPVKGIHLLQPLEPVREVVKRRTR